MGVVTGRGDNGAQKGVGIKQLEYAKEALSVTAQRLSGGLGVCA